VLSSALEVSQTVAAGGALRCRERKVRAPQSGMLGNAQTLQAVRASGGEGEEQGHRDESHPIRMRVKRGNLHPEQHQVSGRKR
jgi:hypothetical protein